MFILIRAILAVILLIAPFFSTAYSGTSDRSDPIAQVYEVQGNATVKSFVDGSIAVVKKGSLLSPDDSLTLDKNASIAVYFKNGGRKEVRANDNQSLYKVADLAPKAEAYAQNVPLFGATRGIPEKVSHPAGFFYPQETVILDSPPLIEFALYRGSGDAVALNGATMRVVNGGAVVDSRKFNSLEYNSSYVYEFPKLNAQAEYKVELSLELQQGLGNVAISFPLYIAGISDPGSVSKYSSFSDSIYRSIESASMDYKGRKRAITAIKQLARRGASSQPVISIELFIP